MRTERPSAATQLDARQFGNPLGNPHSVRTQLMVWNALTLVLLFALLGVVMHFSVRATLLKTVDRELEARAQGHHAPGDPGAPEEPRGAQAPPGAPPEMPPDAGAEGSPDEPQPPPPHPDAQHRQVFEPRRMDRQGKVVSPPFATAPWDAMTLAVALQGRPIFSTVVVDGEAIRILSSPWPPAPPFQGVVQAPFPLTNVYQAVASVDRVLLLLLPVALLGAGLGGVLLTQRALLPVAHLSQTAERIGALDLSQRLPVNGQDEFAALANTFNGMLERLDEAFAAQQELVARLQESIEQQRRFTADASHELRTPLTAIRANASLCLSTPASLEDYQQLMQEVDSAATIMACLVDDLLLLARADANQLGQSRTILAIKPIIDQAITVTSRRVTTLAPISLEVEDNLTILGHTSELVRVFANLLSNAVRYTPAAGSIVVRAARHESVIRISIADNGSGIAPEHLPHIGERFYRVDASRHRSGGGTGLGLAICKSIIMAYDGSLTLTSTLGSGTTVTIILPDSIA